MVLSVSSSPAAVPIQGRSYTKPIIVIIGLAAIAALLLYVAKSLHGRITILDPETLINQGKGLLKEEKYAEAVDKFTAALRCNPADRLLKAQILYHRGLAYNSLHEYGKAIDDLTIALKYSFQNQELHARIYRLRGDVYFDQDDLEKTLENYNQGLACKTSREFKVNFLLARIEVYLRQNEFALALDETTALLRIDSLNSTTRGAVCLQRGNAQMGLGDSLEAIKNFNIAIESLPPDISPVYVLSQRAQAYFAQENFDEAIRDLTTALETDLENEGLKAIMVCQRGFAHSHLKHYQEAIEDFNETFKHIPLDEPYLYIRIERALCFIENDTSDLAIVDMRHALDHESSAQNQVIILLILGRAYAKQTQYERAVENYTAALELNPTDQDKKSELLYFRGVVKQEQKKLEEAAKDWQAALNCDPSDKNLREAIESKLKGDSLVPGPTLWSKLRQKLPFS